MLCFHISLDRLTFIALNIYLIDFYSRCSKQSSTILIRMYIID